MRRSLFVSRPFALAVLLVLLCVLTGFTTTAFKLVDEADVVAKRTLRLGDNADNSNANSLAELMAREEQLLAQQKQERENASIDGVRRLNDAQYSSASYWPKFRGTSNLNQGLALKAGPTNGVLAWKVQLGSGGVSSSVTLGGDGTVYVGSMDFNLYAVYPTTGVVKWKYTTGGSVEYCGAAVASDGTIYFGSDDFYIRALTSSGTLKWAYKTGGKIYSSPLILSSGSVCVGSSDYKIWCIQSNGALLGTYTTGSVGSFTGEVWSSPALFGTTLFFGSNNGYLYGVSSVDASLVWKAAASPAGAVWSSPAVDSNGNLYIGCNDNYLYALTPSGGLKWKFYTGGKVVSSPAISSSAVVFASEDTYIYSVSLASGMQNFRFQVADISWSSPIIDPSGNIFVGANDNTFYALSSTGSLLWKYTTGGGVYSSPAIDGNGYVFVGSMDGYLYAFKQQVSCSAGQYLSGSTCASCPSGQYTSSSGQSTCQSCTAGKYSASGSASCSACNSGTYSSSGAASCSSCTAGSYSSSGATSCLTCAAGSYSSSGAASCSSCSVNQYQPSSGQGSCASCPSGQSTNGATGATVCSSSPTAKPIASPTPVPIASPTLKPIASPTPVPIASPTLKPIASPTPLPISSPTPKPIASPTPLPTASPTLAPKAGPTPAPIASPTIRPQSSPTPLPVSSPTRQPSSSMPTAAVDSSNLYASWFGPATMAGPCTQQTLTQDETGKGNSISGTVATSVVGGYNSVSFDGTKVLTVPSLQKIAFGTQFGVTFWYYRASNNGAYEGLVGNGYYTGGSFEVRMGREFSGQMIGGGIITPANAATWNFVNLVASVGAWHHIAMTYNGAYLNFYIDGVQQLTPAGSLNFPITGSMTPVGNPLYIGGSGSGENLVGSMRDIRLYNKFLVSSDVQTIMNAKQVTSTPSFTPTYLPTRIPTTALPTPSPSQVPTKAPVSPGVTIAPTVPTPPTATPSMSPTQVPNSAFPTWSSSNMSPYQVINDPNTASGAPSTGNFGKTTSCQGNHCIVSSTKNAVSVYIIPPSTTYTGLGTAYRAYGSTLQSNFAAEAATFGSALAVYGLYLAIGAYGNNAVYMYTSCNGACWQWSVAACPCAGGPLTLSQRITPPVGAALTQFGYTIAISQLGNTPLTSLSPTSVLVVGSPANNQAYVYNISPVTNQFVQLASVGVGSSTGFGTSIAMSGNVLAIGTSVQSNGLVYLYNVGASSVTDMQVLTVPSSAGSVMYFGKSLSISSLAGAGGGLLVGSNNLQNSANSKQGYAFFYTQTISTAGAASFMLATTGTDPDLSFGDAVSIYGDTVAVGVPNQQRVSIYALAVTPSATAGGASSASASLLLTLSGISGVGNSIACSANGVAVGLPTQGQVRVYGETTALNPTLMPTPQPSVNNCLAGYYPVGSSCSTCPPNTYSAAGDLTCSSTCKANYYTLSAACFPCASGTSSAAGATVCTSNTPPSPTTLPTALPTSGAVSTTCAAGTFSVNGNGLSPCTSCALGSYSSTAGSNYCIPCVAGQFAASTGQVICTFCAYATYQPSAGSSSCLACPSAMSAGATVCLTSTPSLTPSQKPSALPSPLPTLSPTSAQPTAAPTLFPSVTSGKTGAPSTATPTQAPTVLATSAPTAVKTNAPTFAPTATPSNASPSFMPSSTKAPLSLAPTSAPSPYASLYPTESAKTLTNFQLITSPLPSALGFGSSVSADGNLIAVSAGGSSGAYSVFVYSLSGSGGSGSSFSLFATITSSFGAGGGGGGSYGAASVSVSGSYVSVGYSASGTVSIYTTCSNTCSPTIVGAAITAPPGVTSFGTSLSVFYSSSSSGGVSSMDASGNALLPSYVVVGAPSYNAAFVYFLLPQTCNSGTAIWTLVKPYLTIPNQPLLSSAISSSGYAVSSNGYLIAVGSSTQSNGAVSIYKMYSGTTSCTPPSLLLFQTLVAPSANMVGFGSSIGVSLSGLVIVGTQGGVTGQAALYTLKSSNFVPTQLLESTDAAFGGTVAVYGSTVIVGGTGTGSVANGDKTAPATTVYSYANPAAGLALIDVLTGVAFQSSVGFSGYGVVTVSIAGVVHSSSVNAGMVVYGVGSSTFTPTLAPTASPKPSVNTPPTYFPTFQGTIKPTGTNYPTPLPTASPSSIPLAPTFSPSSTKPTAAPSTLTPTFAPSSKPSGPTPRPSYTFGLTPTFPPNTAKPTSAPSPAPTSAAPTKQPVARPTARPTPSPTTRKPTPSPTLAPTSAKPSFVPTFVPSPAPTSAAPTTSAPTQTNAQNALAASASGLSQSNTIAVSVVMSIFACMLCACMYYYVKYTRAKDKDKPFREWQAWQHKRATLRADGATLAAAGVVGGGAASMHQQQHQQQQHQLYAQHDEGHFQTSNPFFGQAGVRPMSAAFNNGNYGIDQQQQPQQQPQQRGQISEPRRFSNKFAPTQVPAPFFTPHLSSSSSNSISVAPSATGGGAATGAGGDGVMTGGGGSARPSSSRLPPSLPSGRQFSINTFASPRMSVSRKDEVVDNL